MFGCRVVHARAARARRAAELELVVARGVQNRGFGSEVSDLRGDLDANERVEMRNTCLGGE